MCGISGLFRKDRQVSQADIDLIQKMNQIQKHRGPDDSGLTHDSCCVLGHQRLSIIDLTADGHQPFVSEDGRFQLIFNGEIYNYIELRAELIQLGVNFRTQTDTEVLLKAYINFGSDCLRKLNGMFAFVVYDSQAKRLFMARDRIGIKPLYYYQNKNVFYFASEIKALRAIPQLNSTINNIAVFDYLVFNRTDVFDETFTQEIKRIPKGHQASFDENGLLIKRWWHPQWFIDQPNSYTGQEISQQIENLMVSSVKLRMRSDVPVGSCLSGGLDSSTITGILYDHGLAGSDYKTFTSSFPGLAIDETKYVDLLKQRFNFQNFRTFPTPELAYENIKEFVYIQDEPVKSSSVYAQYEVMRLAKENQITVLLDGQGGDENFAGYQYFHGFYLHGLLKQWKLPTFFHELLKVMLRKQDKSAYQTLLFQVLPDHLKKRLLAKACPFIEREFFDAYIDQSRIFNEFFDSTSLNQSLVRHFQYKLEHLLRVEDRNSMAFSLEARVPYLDHRLVEYVLGLPGRLKIKAGHTKILQKQAIGKYTISEILNRKDKVGFAVPQTEWMKTKQWQELSQSSFTSLQKELPGILTKGTSHVSSDTLQWKVNQLSLWYQMISSS